MTPTLNQADLKLLKSIFATKKDLITMEKRLASKKHLEQLESVLAKQFAKIEKVDNNQNKRLTALENNSTFPIN